MSVAQVVEADARQVGLADDLHPSMCEGARLQRPSILLRVDERRVILSDAKT